MDCVQGHVAGEQVREVQRTVEKVRPAACPSVPRKYGPGGAINKERRARARCVAARALVEADAPDTGKRASGSSCKLGGEDCSWSRNSLHMDARFQAATNNCRPEECGVNEKAPEPQAARGSLALGRLRVPEAEKCDVADEDDVDDEAAAVVSHEAIGLLVHPMLPHINPPHTHQSKTPPSPDPLPDHFETSPTPQPCNKPFGANPAVAADHGKEGCAEEVVEVEVAEPKEKTARYVYVWKDKMLATNF